MCGYCPLVDDNNTSLRKRNKHTQAIQLKNTKKSEFVIKMVTFIATLLLYTQQFSLSTLYIKIGNRRHFEDRANIDDVLKHDWLKKEIIPSGCLLQSTGWICRLQISDACVDTWLLQIYLEIKVFHRNFPQSDMWNKQSWVCPLRNICDKMKEILSYNFTISLQQLSCDKPMYINIDAHACSRQIFNKISLWWMRKYI